MATTVGEIGETERLYDLDEIAADRVVHIAAVSGAIVGSAALISTAISAGSHPLWPIIIYCAALVVMFICSAGYNLRRTSRHHQLLQRFDHSAIFVTIAGTYTPFTIDALHGGWASGMTAAIWFAALSGVAVKLVCPRLIERIDIALYLGLGWGGCLVAAHHLLATLAPLTALLIVLGGALYTIGAGFHLSRGLRYHQVFWHWFVVAAAACQFAAVWRLVQAGATCL